jgi:hypothetical protein
LQPSKSDPLSPPLIRGEAREFWFPPLSKGRVREEFLIFLQEVYSASRIAITFKDIAIASVVL